MLSTILECMAEEPVDYATDTFLEKPQKNKSSFLVARPLIGGGGGGGGKGLGPKKKKLFFGF